MRDQRLWTWHLLAGVVILVFLGLHMTVMHMESVIRVFNPAEGKLPIDWANVVERTKSGFFLVSYVVLLAAALFHGLYGLRNILFELNPAAGLKKAVSVVFVVGGLGLFGLGTWAAWTSYVNANNALNIAQTVSR
jgi:predicted ribosomally synthesized peptide with SipW-like signal peptide